VPVDLPAGGPAIVKRAGITRLGMVDNAQFVAALD